MKIVKSWFRSQIAVGMILLITVPTAEAAGKLPQQPTVSQQTQSSSPAVTEPQSSGGQESSGQPTVAQSTAGQTQTSAQAPVGTAVAPYEKPIGVAASRPAGAVIAPAKQRRARSIMIRVAVVVGAAVAVGTVVALTRASPSRPD